MPSSASSNRASRPSTIEPKFRGSNQPRIPQISRIQKIAGENRFSIASPERGKIANSQLIDRPCASGKSVVSTAFFDGWGRNPNTSGATPSTVSPFAIALQGREPGDKAIPLKRRGAFAHRMTISCGPQDVSSAHARSRLNPGAQRRFSRRRFSSFPSSLRRRAWPPLRPRPSPR
jgi:hypothetical protein